MAQGTITSKGQVTIPKSIREKLSLAAGDKVEFVITENNETVMRPITKRVDDVFGKLYKPDRAAISVEEMNEAVRKRAQESVS